MHTTVYLFLVAVTTVVAVPAFPKKYDPLVHGPKQFTSYKDYKKKLVEPLKAPQDTNSYDNFSGVPEDAILPPAEYPYLTAEGVAHGDLSPPPEVLEEDLSTSSYLVYDEKKKVVEMTPPAPSTYAIIPANNDRADAMSLLKFLVRALPKHSSYIQYSAELDTEALEAPDRRSSYIEYADDAQGENITLPNTKHKTDKSISSYSSYV